MELAQELIEKVCEGLPKEHAGLIQAVVQENSDLHKDLEKVTGQLNAVTEAFEQERHCMKKKLEMISNMEQHYTEEISNLQSQLDQATSNSNEQKQQGNETSKLKLKVEELSAALEASHQSERALEERLSRSEKAFEEYRLEHEGVTEQKSLMISEDYLQLQEHVKELQETVEELRENCKDSEDTVKKMSVEKQALQSVVLEKGEDLERIRAELTSYANTLEKVREENLEYQMQLENMKLENTNHGEKGNSLFGELDDRRLMAEKTLVNIQTQCEAAKQQLAREKQQHHRLKVQMTTLLQSNSSNVSSERLVRLESSISQLRTEKEELLAKIHEYEAKEEEFLSKFQTAVQENAEGKQDYTQFLTSIIQTKEEELSRLKREIHQNNLKMLSKDDTVIECNRQIFKLECDLEKSKRKAGRLALQVDELKMKYEPEKETSGIKLGKTEKLPVADETADKDKFVLKESIRPTAASNSASNVSSAGYPPVDSTSQSLYECDISTITEDTTSTKSLLQSSRVVNIKETVETISEDGEKENDRIQDGGKSSKEFRQSVKKTQPIVQQKIIKVPTVHQNNFDKSQCKQQ